MTKQISLYNLSKTYGNKTLFKVKQLEVYDGDRIAIIGLNGSGKSTLLKIVGGRIEPDTGSVKVSALMHLQDQPMGQTIDIKQDSNNRGAHLFDADKNPGFSGGEQTRRALSEIFRSNADVLLFDEPTTNLDTEAIEILEAMLTMSPATLLIVTHDETLIRTVATKLWILEDETVRVFNGSYDDWLNQSALEQETQQNAYDTYRKEKKRLESEAARIRVEAQKAGNKPKHMSSKEARIYAGIASTQQGHVQRRNRQLLSRVTHLDAVERPEKEGAINLDLGARETIRAQYAVVGENFSYNYGDRVLFTDASFAFTSNTKTAIIGPNGSGKTTLIQCILEGFPGIRLNPGLKIGVFSQFAQDIDIQKSVLDNCMDTAIRDQGFVRTVLNNLRFTETIIHKKAETLSGGERAKCVLAKLIVSDINTLILDEPTNHLDLDTKQAMLRMLNGWNHTLIFTSHDRAFVSELATECWEICDGTLKKRYVD